MEPLERVKNYLAVRLLGKPELRWSGRLIISVPPKPRALLLYLAARAEPVPRCELEELLWAPRAHHSLRQALYELRALPGAQHWLLSGQGVAVEAVSDLAIFETLVGRGYYKEALELWPQKHLEARLALLQGFELERAPAFNDWLEVERARVEMIYLSALEQRATQLEQTGEYAQALEWADLLLRHDPLHESAYRMAIRLCYHLGQPQAAFAYFERCRRVLLEELGTAPLEETQLLAHGLEPTKMQGPTQTLRHALEQLPDPRSRQGRRYPLATLLGLVVLAFLGGAHSLHDIVRFGQENPDLLGGLGFRLRTPPGRSTLSELLHHLNLSLLQRALNSVVPVQASVGQQTDPLGLLESWAQEVRYRLHFGEPTHQPSRLLEQFGWPSQQGSLDGKS